MHDHFHPNIGYIHVVKGIPAHDHIILIVRVMVHCLQIFNLKPRMVLKNLKTYSLQFFKSSIFNTSNASVFVNLQFSDKYMGPLCDIIHVPSKATHFSWGVEELIIKYVIAVLFGDNQWWDCFTRVLQWLAMHLRLPKSEFGSGLQSCLTMDCLQIHLQCRPTCEKARRLDQMHFFHI